MDGRRRKSPCVSSSTDEALLRRLDSELNEALAKVIERAQAILAEADLEELLRNWELGGIVDSMVNSPACVYGHSPIPALVKAIGCGKTLLYDYATIASQWQPGEIDALLERCDKRCETQGSFRLTWSHFLAVKGSDLDDETRRRWIDTAIRRKLSAKDLMALIAAARGDDQQTFLWRVLASRGKLLKSLRGHFGRLEAALHSAPPLDLETIQLADATIADFERLRAQCDEALRQLRARVAADRPSAIHRRVDSSARRETEQFSADAENVAPSEPLIWETASSEAVPCGAAS